MVRSREFVSPSSFASLSSRVVGKLRVKISYEFPDSRLKETRQSETGTEVAK